jgi:hypothetical protein
MAVLGDTVRALLRLRVVEVGKKRQISKVGVVWVGGIRVRGVGLQRLLGEGVHHAVQRLGSLARRLIIADVGFRGTRSLGGKG